jgi:hypothetical protein
MVAPVAAGTLQYYFVTRIRGNQRARPDRPKSWVHRNDVRTLVLLSRRRGDKFEAAENHRVTVGRDFDVVEALREIRERAAEGLPQDADDDG